MEHFTLAALRQLRARTGERYHEFLRAPSMSVGVYELAADAEDPQQPHSEDELYYVVAGHATLLVGAEEVPVKTGALVFVPAQVVHRFHDITEALTVLVFFAPAENSQRGQHAAEA